MKNKKRILTLLVVSAMSLSLAGCGATTAGENTSTYFSLVSNRVNTMFGGDTTGAADTDTREKLATPADFTFDAEGNYSFKSVDNAEYYVIYMYKNGNKSYDYVSEGITGEGTLSGSVADLNFAYGDYEVTVVAYPNYNDTERRASDAASASITKTGEVVEPELTFFWDCFAEELQVIWLNSGAYSTTDYPQTMEVVLSGDATGDYEFTMDSATTAYTIEDAKIDATYSVTANITFDSNYVTNDSFEVELGSVTCDAQANFAPEGYEYNGGIYNYADYPIAALNFDVTAGGEVGRWKISKVSNFGPPGAGGTSSAEYLIYTATPAETEEGDLYTYNFVAANDDDSDVYTSNFGSMHDFTGKLHLYEDGTFLMQSDAIYICTDLISNAEQWHNGSTIEGIWYENENGSVDLSFNLGSEVDLGKGTR